MFKFRMPDLSASGVCIWEANIHGLLKNEAPRSLGQHHINKISSMYSSIEAQT